MNEASNQPSAVSSQPNEAASEKLAVITVRLPASEHERVKAAAKKMHCSMNVYCVSAIVHAAERDLLPAEGTP